MRFAIILLGLCLSVITYAQDYKLGKVSKEELEEKFNPLDSSANATYLYKFRNTFFRYLSGEGYQLITDIHERIKIYNQEGFGYATKSINLHKNNSDIEKLSNLKAITYNLTGGKIDETKLEKKDVFNIEQSIYNDETKFTMPNIKEGSVIEYKYTITSPFYINVDEFLFQHGIPIKKLEARFEAPEYFNFKVNIKGFLNIISKKDSQIDEILVKSQSVVPGEGGRIDKWENKLEFIKHISTYNLENVPALKDEPYVNNINNYRSAVKYELSFTHFPKSIIKYYSTTWEDVVKTIYESPNFGNELNKTGYYEDDIDVLIGSVSDPLQRAALIYDFVKTTVKWNGYYSKYTNDGVRKAFKDHVGNVAEINLMLTSMLRHAGLNANPVLVSTRQNGIPLFPTREGYNYVISSIELSDGVILLDATNKYSMPNVLPFRALNWDGRIIRKDGSSSIIGLYPNENSKNIISMMVALQENGDIEGSYRSVKTNHDALLYRDGYNDVNETDFLEKLENKYDGLEVSGFKVTNALELSKPVMESYKFFKENQIDIIGDKLYFSPMFFLKTTESPFKLEKREFPIDFGYSSGSTYRISIQFPDGYKIESIPEPFFLVLPDNLGSFKYNITINESMIQLIVENEINESIISPIYYETLKEYFKQFMEKENEQIILIKK